MIHNLKEFRRKKGLSQRAMAQSIGVTLSMYEKVETGRAHASSAFMARVKKAYPDANIDAIFFMQTQAAPLSQECDAAEAQENAVSVNDCIFALERIKFHLEHYDELQSLFTKEYREELATLEIKVLDQVISMLECLQQKDKEISWTIKKLKMLLFDMERSLTFKEMHERFQNQADLCENMSPEENERIYIMLFATALKKAISILECLQ